MSTVEDDLRLALSLADAADALTVPRFLATDLVVDTKPDLTPVTEADRAVEQEVRRLLAGTRPDDGIVGEEFGVEPSRGGDGARWIVDPIDGTKNYVRGIPVWGTLIALERGGSLVVGVASAPALGRRWWAARGMGAFADGRPIRVSAVSALDDAQLSYDGIDGWDEIGATDRFLALARRCWRTRAFGDFWQHMLVAEGAVDVVVEPAVALWDLAAVQVIVEEAGGRFSDFDGVARADGGNCVVTNGLLHDEVLAALA